MKLKFALVALAPAMLAACSQASDPTTAESTEAAAPDVVVPSGDYALDKNHASLLWSITHMGVAEYVVRMADIDSQLTLNTEDLSQSKVVLTINPLSVSTNYPSDYTPREGDGYASWDEEIGKSPNFLDGGNSAPITFTSTKVVQTGPTTADVTGDLTLRGQTRPLTMEATLSGQMEKHPFGGMPVVGFSATGSFNPADFGVNLMNGALGDKVTITFHGEYQGAKAEAEAPAAAE